jgi:hypothetical protein
MVEEQGRCVRRTFECSAQGQNAGTLRDASVLPYPSKFFNPAILFPAASRLAFIFQHFFPSPMRSAPLLLLSILVSLIPPFAISQTNYCCNAPNFGDAWCHSSACLGAGCRNEPDPITGQSQANYLCDDLSNCICSGANRMLALARCRARRCPRILALWRFFV